MGLITVAEVPTADGVEVGELPPDSVLNVSVDPSVADLTVEAEVRELLLPAALHPKHPKDTATNIATITLNLAAFNRFCLKLDMWFDQPFEIGDSESELLMCASIKLVPRIARVRRISGTECLCIAAEE